MYSQIETNKRKSFFLIFFFTIFILFLGWLLGQITQTGYSWLVIAFCFALIMGLSGYFSGDKMALWTAGAKEIKKENNPYLFKIVENLCITAGIPVPKIHVIQDPAPNAFATGRNPEHASLAVTTGLIDILENEELEGVIAHELSHVKNYDIRLMTLVLALVGVISLLSNWFLRFSFFGGNRRSNDQQGSAGTIMMFIGIVLMIFSPLIAQLIKLAVSRKREYLADASGALLTRYPEGLASALEKISKYEKPLKRANPASAHLYIASPFGKVKTYTAKLFSTHPPIEDRIKALREI